MTKSFKSNDTETPSSSQKFDCINLETYKNKKRNFYGGIEIKFLEQIRRLLSNKKKLLLKELIYKLHTADVADLLERLNYSERYRMLF